MNISMKAAVVALVALSGGSALAQTTTVNFTYSGSAFGTSFSTGSGSFSFPSSMTSAGISHLTAFSFTTSRDSPGTGFSSTYTYGLSDLSAFAVELTPSGGINSLGIRTNELNAFSSSGPAARLAFATAGWTTGTNSGTGQLESEVVGRLFVDTAGTVTVTSIVPAPGVAALLGAGGLLVARRRRA